MFVHNEVFHFFATPIWLNQIDPGESTRINEGIKQKIDQLIAMSPDKSHSGMWQTEHDFHTLPEMEELHRCFLEAANDVVETLELKAGPSEITGCWANISPAGDSHKSHMHANNFLSGVYYVAVPPGGDRITFHDPRTQPFIMAPEARKANVYNSKTVYLEVREGVLILFPAWLVHSVPENASNDLRISIAFNVNFSNFTEQISPPRWEPALRTHPERA